MKDHIAILELASRNALPESIDWKSTISFQAATELVEAGHLTGTYVNSTNGSTIFMPAITLSGRQFLAEQKKRIGFSGWLRSAYEKSKPVLGWGARILAAVIGAYLVKVIVGK